MHKTAIAYAIGKLMQVLGLILLGPLALAFYDARSHPLGETLARPEVVGFIVSALLCGVIGTASVRLFRGGRELTGVKEGYAIVALGWVWLTLWSCLPLFFYLYARDVETSGHLLRSFTDAYFEIMSGYTTTGATILTDVEVIPRSLLLLRALTHWLGGMGIITLAIAIFPSLGVTAYSMFRGEVPGPSKDKLAPKLAQTVSVLWGVYVLFTGAEAALLWLGDMNLFEAVCHAFATMATGGFSTEDASVAAYQSDYIEWVITIFMFLAGVNFVLHYRALRGDVGSLTSSPEFRFYSGVIVGAILVFTLVLYFNGPAPMDRAQASWRHEAIPTEAFEEHYRIQEEQVGTLYGSFRTSAFQVVSVTTTTGFCTADFDLWPDFLRFALILLMFFGGCAGSTGGGIKMVRIMLVLKLALTQLRKLSQPRLVAPVKLARQVVDDKQMVSVMAFFVLFTTLFLATGLAMTLFVPDLTTALAASIATIGNIGPGLAGVGAIENYSWIPIPGKWILVFSMLLGRLEIFTVLVIFRPAVWRK